MFAFGSPLSSQKKVSRKFTSFVRALAFGSLFVSAGVLITACDQGGTVFNKQGTENPTDAVIPSNQETGNPPPVTLPERPVPAVVTVAPPPCNHNGVCDSGEMSDTCRSDCPCVINGTCERAEGENSSNCSADCLVRDTSPCADPEKSVWVVSPRSLLGSGVEDGTAENPFRSLTAANAAATGGDRPKDVCVMEGEYPLTETLSPSTNFYGSFYKDATGAIQRRNVSDETGRTSLLLLSARVPAVKYDLSRSASLIFDGFYVKDQGNGSSAEPLLLIENSNPLVRNNNFERSPGNSGGFGATVDRLAVRMKASHGSLNAIFTGNLVTVPQNESPAGSNLGVELKDETIVAGASPIAHIGRNRIVVGGADRASVGLLGFSNRSDSNLTVIVSGNEIQFGAAVQEQRGSLDRRDSDVGVSVSDGGYRGPLMGGESAGIALGVSLNPNLAATPFLPKAFGRAGVRDNKIRGNSSVTSGYRSRGIYLVSGKNPTASNLFNNFVQAGKGKKYSWGVDVEGSPSRLHSNTISAARVEEPWEGEPCDRGFLGLGACGGYDPMGYAAGIQVTKGAPNLEVTNNIFMAPPVGGRYKNVGVFLTRHNDSFSRIDFNLFDNASFCRNCLFHGFNQSSEETWLSLERLSTELTNAIGNRKELANLMDLAGFDFHLRPESAAKNNGVCMPEGVNDIDGDSRPFDGACDIGADEYDPLHLRR